MSKFKVGDKICYINGDAFSNKKKIVTIARDEGHSYWLKEPASRLSKENTHSRCRLVEASKQHKHAAFIHAWADGAEIERYRDGEWINQTSPIWNNASIYRIKPEKSAAELEKEDIIKEMEALKVRLDKLEVN